MRIATWNVNSIRTRKTRVIDFLHSADIDVLAMQETKCRDDQFPWQAFSDAGYDVAHYGLNQWNGVALASRLPLSDIELGFPGMPGFAKDSHAEQTQEARAISASVEGIRLCSVYVPNGRSPTDPHFDYKLTWLDALGQAVCRYVATAESCPLAVLGDFNIAPFDSDVGDPEFLIPGSTHTSDRERNALANFLANTAMSDVVRALVPDGFTFWDYKQGKFPKNQGLRIDFIFGTEGFVNLVDSASIEPDQRQGDGPSDHVPVVVELGLGDPDDRPMVF